MIDEKPTQRPSASTLVHHPCIMPDASKSKAQLRKELNQEKFKNEMLKQKVMRYEQQLTKSDSSVSRLENNKITELKISSSLLRPQNPSGSNVNSTNGACKFPRSFSSSIL